jgi:glucose/arabinose dehydrogenase
VGKSTPFRFAVAVALCLRLPYTPSVPRFRIALACVLASAAQAADVPPGVWARDGFRLEVAAEHLAKPRFMAFGDRGELYVTLSAEKEIVALRDADADGFYEASSVLVSGHPRVHAVQFLDGWLYFTESGAIFRARDEDGDGKADETQDVAVPGALPEGGGHWYRPVLIHGGRLYTGIGDSRNISDERETDRQKIWSYAFEEKEGRVKLSDRRLFASGIRNTEKLVVRPGTDEIWGMDHGSDWFGQALETREQFGQPITDLNPPCEMNHYVEGGFYGHPFVAGNRVVRYEFMEQRGIVALAARTIPPAWCAGAHWAPNAMCFYDADTIPGARGDAFVAYHGSWNRTTPGGYCVTRVFFENGLPYGEQAYAKFLAPGTGAIGRPVDVIVAPDGSLLISDDYGGRIYRLSAAR